jgi:hypothetical protein
MAMGKGVSFGWWGLALRIGFGALGLTALAFGYLGYGEFLKHSDEYSHDHLDLLYYDLQLFVLGSPPLDAGAVSAPLPPMLQIARFAAPVFTGYAVAEAARLLFSSEVRRLQIRLLRGHIIICGETVFCVSLARRLRAEGRKVVMVIQTRDPDPFEWGPLWIVGDVLDPAVLWRAGLGGASSVFLCTAQSATNSAVALATRQSPNLRHRPDLRVFSRISDPDLCLALQARYLGDENFGGPQVDFFNVEEVAARRLCAGQAAHVRPGQRVLILGATTFGRAMIVELVRQWTTRGQAEKRPSLILADTDATETIAFLSRRFSFLEQASLTAYDISASSVLAHGVPDGPADQVFVCYDEEEIALRAALSMAHTRPAAIVVRLDSLVGLQDPLTVGSELDGMPRGLRPFGVVPAACDPDLLSQDLMERLARAMHDSYLRGIPARDGAGTAPTRAAVPWEELPPELRRSNRAEAADIGRKLRAIGCDLTPRNWPGDDHELSPGELVRFAEMEHERWRVERTETGWRYGRVRDDAALESPLLVPWDQLTESDRDRNVRAAGEISKFLAEAGFRITRQAHE